MAELILKVTPQEVIDKASAISAKRTQMEELMNEMETFVKSLAESWSSTSGDQYVEKYAVVRREANDSLTNLQTHVDHLNAAARIYSENEQALQQETASLTDSDIF